LYYALVADDVPESSALRMELRPEHLKHLEGLGEKLLLAGPFLDAEGQMTGSIVIIEAESQSDAEEMFGRDPYVRGGLFATKSIRPWRLGPHNIKA
jgi:uncharacterized protein YciI